MRHFDTSSLSFVNRADGQSNDSVENSWGGNEFQRCISCRQTHSYLLGER